MALANTLAGYYMLCTSEHTMEHVMGSYHDDLVHGAGLIMLSHAYYDFFAERKAAEEPMMKMAKAMGVANPTSGKDFIKALDDLLEAVDCHDLRMSDVGITRDELKTYPKRIHDVLGGDITADPIPLSDDDYLKSLKKPISKDLLCSCRCVELVISWGKRGGVLHGKGYKTYDRV